MEQHLSTPQCWAQANFHWGAAASTLPHKNGQQNSTHTFQTKGLTAHKWTVQSNSSQGNENFGGIWTWQVRNLSGISGTSFYAGNPVQAMPQVFLCSHWQMSAQEKDTREQSWWQGRAGWRDTSPRTLSTQRARTVPSRAQGGSSHTPDVLLLEGLSLGGEGSQGPQKAPHKGTAAAKGTLPANWHRGQEAFICPATQHPAQAPGRQDLTQTSTFITTDLHHNHSKKTQQLQLSNWSYSKSGFQIKNPPSQLLVQVFI